MNTCCVKPTVLARRSAGLIVLLTVCLVAPAALAADRPQPVMQPGGPHVQPSRQSRAPVKGADPRVTEFKRELGSYQKNLATLQREVQRLQAQQRRLNTLARQLQTVGDDSQMLQFELQQAMQKQQQVIQTLSNISKQTHETQSNIIRNMK